MPPTDQPDDNIDQDAVQQPSLNPGDEAPAGTPGTGDDVCPVCQGSGRLEDAQPCPNCGGSGVITEGIGGG